MDSEVEHVIKLSDGGPWGFRLAGGADYRCPLQVSKVRVNSKAYHAGLEERDIITAIDDKDVRLASHRDVMRLVEQGGENISITVLRGVESGINLYKTFIQEAQESRSNISRVAEIRSNQSVHQQQSLEANIVRSREPSISRAQVTLGRAPSPGRALHIITRSQSKERQLGPNFKSDRLLTVNTEPQSPVEYKSYQSEIEPRKLPPAKPGSKGMVIAPRPVPLAIHRASSLPRTTPGTSITQHIHPVHSTEEVSGHSSFQTQRRASLQPVVVPIKPFEQHKKQSEIVEFRVRDMKTPKHVWQPERDGSENMYSPSGSARLQNYKAKEQHQKEPARFYWELMENQPDHLPGMNDPLIIDDTQGDFGGNPIIHPERDVYSDSNFYKTNDKAYPTIPEQMRLCRMISGILDTPAALRSRGGKMYQQRKNNADKWAKESMGRKYEHPYDGLDAEYSRPYGGMPHWPSRMKENLTIDELERLEHNTENISKHDLLPPVVAFDINSALTRSRNHGKGVDIYRRNAERAEEFTIDENNVQQARHPSRIDSQVAHHKHQMQMYKSPWRAAQGGNLDRAFIKTDPFAAQSVKDETEFSQNQQQKTTHSPGYDHQQSVFGVRYKDFAPVHAPRGPPIPMNRQFSASTSALDMVGRPQARLDRMIQQREQEKPTFDTYTYKWCLPSYYDERRKQEQSYVPAEGMQRYGSMIDMSLRRPKEYIRPSSVQHLEPEPAVIEAGPRGPPPTLRRPRDYHDEQECYEYTSPLTVVTAPYASRSPSIASGQPGISCF